MSGRIFIDMDGVLCEYRADMSVADMERPGYFKSLAPREGMLRAVKELVRSGEYEVFILSSVLPSVRESSVTEKNEWLDTYLPQIDMSHRIFPLCGTEKADAVEDMGTSDVLCDDYSPNLCFWADRGGAAVKIINEVNGKKGIFRRGPRVFVNDYGDLYRAIKEA